MAFGIFSKTEGKPAGADWRDAAAAIPKTEAPQSLVAKVASNLARMPVDIAAKSAARAHARVVDACCDVERAKIALEQVCKENAAREALQRETLDKARRNHTKAVAERDREHKRVLTELKDAMALEECKYVDFKWSMDDEDVVPTVRLETE